MGKVNEVKALLEGESPLVIKGATVIGIDESYTGIVNIPKGVYRLGENSLMGSKISGIVFPEGFRSLLNGSLAETKNLKKLVIPKSVLRIEMFALRNSGVEEIVFERDIRLKDKYEGACYECTNLKKVRMLRASKCPGDMFTFCRKLRSVLLPMGLEIIGDSAFFGCSGLSDVRIPSTVRSIGNDAFFNCEHLESVEIPEGVTEIKYSAFSACSGLKEISLPETLKFIKSEAFENCSSLKSVIIPRSTSKIGSRAFLGCTSLVRIRIPRYCDYKGADIPDTTNVSRY